MSDKEKERDPGSAFFYMIACAFGKFLNDVMPEPADIEDAALGNNLISPLKSNNPLYCAVHRKDKSDSE